MFVNDANCETDWDLFSSQLMVEEKKNNLHSHPAKEASVAAMFVYWLHFCLHAVCHSTLVPPCHLSFCYISHIPEATVNPFLEQKRTYNIKHIKT